MHTSTPVALAAAARLAIGASASAEPPHYPQTAALGSTPTAAAAATVRSALGRSFGKEWADYEKTGHQIRFTVGYSNLNGDGRPDLFVSLTDSGFDYCGSGRCAGHAILATPQDYASGAAELAYFSKRPWYARHPIKGYTIFAMTTLTRFSSGTGRNINN